MSNLGISIKVKLVTETPGILCIIKKKLNERIYLAITMYSNDTNIDITKPL